jgi:hypothetical protein
MDILRTWPAGRFKTTEAIHLTDDHYDRLVLRSHTEAGKSYEVQINFRDLDELVEVVDEIKRRIAARRSDKRIPGVPSGRKRCAP